MKGSRGGNPSLMKRMVAALSSKTKDLRTQIMIFFLLHRGTNLLQLDSISHKLHALFTNVGGGVHHHHHHKKKNDEDLLDGGGREQHELLRQPEAYEDEDEHGNDRKDQESVGQLPAMYYNNYRNNINDDLYVDSSSKAPGVSEIIRVEEEDMKCHYDKLHDDDQEMVPMEEEELDDDNIDQAADLFIKRFRQQIWLQKQLSSCEFNRGALDSTTMIST